MTRGAVGHSVRSPSEALHYGAHHLLHAMDHHVRQFDEEGAARLFHATMAQFMAALAVEGILSEIGALCVPEGEWRVLDGALRSFGDRRAYLCERLGLPWDAGQRPFQSVRALRLIRNELAHPRLLRGRQPTFKRFRSVEQARRLVTDAREVVRLWWTAAGLPEHELYVLEDSGVREVS